MNARVFLLVLVTAAFMAVWDADRPPESRQVVARSNHATTTASTGKSACDKAPAIEGTSTNTDSTQGTVLPQTLADDDKLIPLPMNLHTGTWHAFNHEGDSIRITIERSSIPRRAAISNVKQSPETSTDTCVITGSDGVRWCFVKDQTPTAH